MIFVPVILFLVIWFWNRLWFRVVRGQLEVDVTVRARAVEMGGPCAIAVRVRNLSWLPCPSVHLSLELPPGLSADPTVRRPAISWNTYVMMRQEVVVEAVCYGWRRGLQDFRSKPVVLRVNDGFGIRDLFLTREVAGEVVVYPAGGGVPAAIPSLRALNGELEQRRWLYPDEALLRGIRAYQLGDPLKHVAWQASARMGIWMTKEFSSSADVSATLVLNGQFYEPHWNGTQAATFDQLCGAASSLAAALERQRVPVFFASNAVSPGNVRAHWYGRQSAANIRWLAGRMLSYTHSDLADILPSVLARTPQDAPLLMVTAFVSDRQRRLLERTARVRSLYLIVPEGAAVTAPAGAQVVRLPVGPSAVGDESRGDEVMSSESPRR
ncbi:MAG: DUF58 domain-containing protein [Alicyclobacillus sp.]|nr:DUF58 domain-containing protein [Alicyclobacillus sp.]